MTDVVDLLAEQVAQVEVSRGVSPARIRITDGVPEGIPVKWLVPPNYPTYVEEWEIWIHSADWDRLARPIWDDVKKREAERVFVRVDEERLPSVMPVDGWMYRGLPVVLDAELQ